MSIKKFLRRQITKFRHPEDIYDCFYLLFIATFCFGLSPFHVAKNESKSRELSISVFGFLNILLRLLIADACFYYNFFYETSMVSLFFQSELSIFTANMQKISGMLSVTCVLLLILLLKYEFKSVIDDFVDLERRLKKIGIMIIQFGTALRTNIIVLLMGSLHFIFLYYGVLGILAKYRVPVSTSMTIAFHSPNYIACGVVMLFCAITFKITAYFQAVNEVLKNLGNQWENSSTKPLQQKQRSLQCLDSFSMYTIVTKNPSEIVQESMEIHQLICEAATTANKYFTYQLLTIISIAFLIIVFDAYYVLETLLGKSKRESKFKTVEFVTFFSCQMILYLIAIISIVEGSNRAIKKSEKTGGIVHSLLNKAKDPEVKEKLKQFSMQLMHLKINFTAAGLFNIDRTLYFTISGALTTYLIILLQFTNSSGTFNSSGALTGNGTNGTAE